MKETKPTSSENPGFYRMNNDDLEFVRLPSGANDDALKVFVLFAVITIGVLFGSIVYIMSLVIEPPSISELVKHQKSMKPNR